MTKSLESSIVRIYDPTSNNVVGAGFLVEDRLVLTCAHVVEAALGIGHSVEIPNGTVQLDFPLVARGQRLTARIVFWNPVNPGVFGEDIAGLELETPLPDTAKAARLVSSKNLSNHPFSVFGFPRGQENGAWAYGQIKDITANGWLQLDATRQTGYQLEHGFSGAPIWDDELGGIVGIAVAVDGNRPEIRVAFIIPTQVLVTAWADLIDRVDLLETEQISSNLPSSGVAKFVGRDDVLTQLATQLQTCDRIAISTLTGMGGIGKSELALQYAQQEYKKNTYLGGITWLNVADSDVGTRILSFAQLYLGLTLPTDGTLEERVRFCWQNWFRNKQDESLIIFDDVREYKQIKAYLPPQTEKRFKVIITTRNNNLSATIQTLQLPILGEDAALDLLRSYVEDGRIDQELDAAKSLCRDLGYLPLALELVARLLRRRNNWSVEDIRRRLSEKGLRDKSLQKDERFDEEMTPEKGVEAAFDLTWENLDENSRLLAMYLSLFALAPVSKSLIDEAVRKVQASVRKSRVNSFPKKLIRVFKSIKKWLFSPKKQTPVYYDDLLGEQDPDDIEEWLADNLVNLNLVNDLGNNWYELHTLIRVYLREKLEESAFKEEAKRAYCKVMVDIAKDVNETLTLADVSRLKPYIDHLKIAVDELNEWLGEENLIWPFIGLGWFYEGQGLYDQAASYREQCLIVSEKRLGENHPDVASSLNNLAALYVNQGRYTEAEPLYIRALSIREQQLGENHPDVATSLNNLALLYDNQGRYTEAEPLYIRALSIYEQQLGENHPLVATSLNNLALLYDNQGRYTEAEPLYIRALSIREQQLGENHPDVATNLNGLALLYDNQGRYTEAEPLYIRALSIREQQLGENHPSVVTILKNLAGLYQAQGSDGDAASILQRAQSIQERLLKSNDS